jgi:hypothetical protein
VSIRISNGPTVVNGTAAAYKASPNIGGALKKPQFVVLQRPPRSSKTAARSPEQDQPTKITFDGDLSGHIQT